MYNKQLRQSIGNKLNFHNRNLPIFPMMDDQNSLASDTLMRPGSFRPGSASNPDFMLPKDVQYYYKQKEKIFSKLDSFYGEEKKGIEEMMDECLKSIITLFEEHKQDLFKVLNEDKETFGKVYNRFSEGVDSFLKSAETRLENNLKAYEARIVKIQEDDQNPLGTHIEKLRLEKEMINSKERLIREIKQSYEKSTIPWDKQKIGELMVDEYKKKHSANVSNLAQHMQKMIGGLKKSIEGFTTFKNYSTLDITTKKEEGGFGQGKPLEGEENMQMKQMMGNLNGMMRQSNMGNNLGGFGVGGSQMNMPLTQQQIMLQNLAQMGISPNFLGSADSYQMALLKAQMGVTDPKDPMSQKNYLSKNYDGTILNPHINGNLNINLLQAQGKEWENQGEKEKEGREGEEETVEGDDRRPKIRPAIKSPNQKLAELKREEKLPEKMLVNKKSVTFNLTQSQNDEKRVENSPIYGTEKMEGRGQEREEQPVQAVEKRQEDDINEVIRKYKKIEPAFQSEAKPEGQNERAKSPILEAKESINQLNEIYENSKNKLLEYQYRKEGLGTPDYAKYDLTNHSRADEVLRRQTEPFKTSENRFRPNPSLESRERTNTFNAFQDPSLHNMLQPKEADSGLKISPFPTSMSKHKFDKNILKPKDKKKLEADINRLGEKYGAGRTRPNRPLSQNIKTVRSVPRPSKNWLT